MAKRKMPDFPNAADTLGWAYYKLGSPEAPPWMVFRNAHIKARGLTHGSTLLRAVVSTSPTGWAKSS